VQEKALEFVAGCVPREFRMEFLQVALEGLRKEMGERCKRALAKRIGISRPVLYRYLDGDILPRRDAFLGILRVALELSPERTFELLRHILSTFTEGIVALETPE